ncbi:MAG: hypothetical protein HUU60_12475 [Armatimonadetes bacterium]|nr:hypothetical protein [Armatimonadota bacterium]
MMSASCSAIENRHTHTHTRTLARAPLSGLIRFAVLALLALAFLIQPPKAPGQNQYAVTGKWDYIKGGSDPFEDPRMIRMREHPFGLGSGLSAPYKRCAIRPPTGGQKAKKSATRLASTPSCCQAV